jgi:hypothetical protein
MKIIERIKDDVRTDVTWNRVFYLGQRGLFAAPSAALLYVLEKVPIIGWLPRYDYRWLLNDVVAGLTLALMLIPQSLAYAKSPPFLCSMASCQVGCQQVYTPSWARRKVRKDQPRERA